jgi:hypothetical protein
LARIKSFNAYFFYYLIKEINLFNAKELKALKIKLNKEKDIYISR